jgi:hypothetical protein
MHLFPQYPLLVLCVHRDFQLGLQCVTSVTFLQNNMINCCCSSICKRGVQKFSRILGASFTFLARVGWCEASTMLEGPQFWSDLWTSRSSGALCLVHANWYTLLYVGENPAIIVLKILFSAGTKFSHMGFVHPWHEVIRKIYSYACYKTLGREGRTASKSKILPLPSTCRRCSLSVWSNVQSSILTLAQVSRVKGQAAEWISEFYCRSKIPTPPCTLQNETWRCGWSHSDGRVPVLKGSSAPVSFEARTFTVGVLVRYSEWPGNAFKRVTTERTFMKLSRFLMLSPVTVPNLTLFIAELVE